MRLRAFISIGLFREALGARLHRSVLTIHVYKRRIIFDTNMLAGGFVRRRPAGDIA